MAEARHIGRLYLRLIVARIRAQLRYPTSFATELFAVFLLSFVDVVTFAVVFEHVPALEGWTVAEVAFLYGASSLSFALADLVVGHLDHLPELIRDGTFDLYLVRPRGPLFMVTTGEFQLRRLGRGAQAVVVMWWALAQLDLQMDAARVAMIVAMVVIGAVLFCAIWVAMITIVFWMVDGREVTNAFTDGGTYLAQYPITIYDRWLRTFLAYIIPSAFVCYYPSLVILGKAHAHSGIAGALPYASPIVAAVAWVVAGFTWRFAIRHYRSAGG